MDHQLFLAPAVGFVLSAVAMEWWICARQGRSRSIPVMIGNGWMALFEQAAGLLLYTGLVGVYAAVSTFAPVRWPIDAWLTWIAAFVLVDLAFYAYHRFCHTTSIGWALHAVHHQSPQLDLTAALRNAPLGGGLQFLFHVPLALIGVPTEAWLLAKVINPLWQLALHTEAVGRVPWAEGWLNTPSAHRVHHGTQDAYRDRNLGGVFVVWDRLFGTWTAEGEPPRYGTVPPLDTLDPILAQWGPVGALLGARAPARARLGGRVHPEAVVVASGLLFAGILMLVGAALGRIPPVVAVPALIVGGSLTARTLDAQGVADERA